MNFLYPLYHKNIEMSSVYADLQDFKREKYINILLRFSYDITMFSGDSDRFGLIDRKTLHQPQILLACQ